MSKRVVLMLMLGIVSIPVHAIKFIFKGGATNMIDLAIFKGEKGFENFITATKGSKSAARAIQNYTKENSAAIGDVAGGAAGAVAASKGGAPPQAIAQVVASAKAAGKLVAEGVGHLSVLGATVVRTIARKYANHYFENLTPTRNNIVCRALKGKNRLIRHKTLIGKDDLMDPNDKRDIFIAIFNKGTIKGDKDNLIARSYDVIYADLISAADLNATFEVTTYVLTRYATEADGKTRKKDASGNDIVLGMPTLAAYVKKVSNTGGEDCPLSMSTAIDDMDTDMSPSV